MSGGASSAEISTNNHPLVGVWTNERNEFKRANIMLFESGRGVIIIGFAPGYFEWELLESGEIHLEFYVKSQPPIAIFYDKAKESIIMRGGGNEEIFKKSDEPLREDPIIAALKEDRRLLIEKKKKFENKFNIKIEEHIGLQRAKDLYAIASKKGGDYGYGVYFGQYPDKRVVSLSERNQKIKLFLHISEAIDETLPKKFRKTFRNILEMPIINIPKRVFISQADDENIQSYLKANSIQFKSIYNKFDYIDGYKIGFNHFLIVSLDENNVDKVINKIMDILIKKQTQVSVHILRKRKP